MILDCMGRVFSAVFTLGCYYRVYFEIQRKEMGIVFIIFCAFIAAGNSIWMPLIY